MKESTIKKIQIESVLIMRPERPTDFNESVIELVIRF